jgi:hypothetical protein
MNSTAKDPQVSPRAALLFQGGIGVVGLGFILLFGVPVQNEGVALALRSSGGWLAVWQLTL